MALFKGLINTTITVSYDGEEFTVNGNYLPYRPGCTWKEAENCFPNEGGGFETIISIKNEDGNDVDNQFTKERIINLAEEEAMEIYG